MASHLTSSEDPATGSAIAQRSHRTLQIETYSEPDDTFISFGPDFPSNQSPSPRKFLDSDSPDFSIDLEWELEAGPMIIGEISAPSSSNLCIGLPTRVLTGKEGTAWRSAWPRFFARHSTLRELYIKGDAYEPIMDVLQRTSGTGRTCAPLLPCLTSLTLEAISFNPLCAPSPQALRRPDKEPTPLARFLADRVAAKRAGAVAVLPRVVIRRCVGVTEDMLEELRYLTAEEEWDESIIWDGERWPQVDSDDAYGGGYLHRSDRGYYVSDSDSDMSAST